MDMMGNPLKLLLVAILTGISPATAQDPHTALIIKTLQQNRQAMVNAAATIAVAAPPMCPKPLPPDSATKVGILAAGLGYKTDQQFLADVKSKSVEMFDRMSRDRDIRDGICAYAQVISVLLEAAAKVR